MTTSEQPQSESSSANPPTVPPLTGPPPEEPGNTIPAGHSGFRLRTLIGVALLSAAIASAASLTLSQRGMNLASPHEDADAPLYQCPMHPSIVQDHPGDCPICGMKLVQVERSKAQTPQKDASNGKVLFYRSPMDPKVTSPTPRKDEMGMDYVPVYEGDVAEAKGPSVPGLASVNIDAERQQLIGLKTVEVTPGPVGGTWRTLGRVAVDETRVRHVNLKVSGFIERLYVNYVGRKVHQGEPLFSIYSPELLAAQEEYLLALKTRAQLSKVGPGVTDSNLVAAARRKLELWDIPQSTLNRIEQTEQPTKTLTLYSPATGVVTKKDVVEGMKLDAGAMPFEIVDLSNVWVLADVYESELRLVKEGMEATLSLAALPDREFKGKVVFLDPLLDPQTRTVKVRLTFRNPTGELRPEMFGEVVLRGRPHDGLRIPTDAIIDSGTEKVVFVATGDGKFEPRIIRVGEKDESEVEVTSGLNQGERVVTRANFLVDSESRLRASLSALAPAPQNGSPAPESARALPEVPSPARSSDVSAKSPDTPPRALPSGSAPMHEHHGDHAQ